MNFELQTPSLQHLSLVKIVAHLWTQRDMFIQIVKSLSGARVDVLKHHVDEWMAIEDKVKGKVLALPLPETCKRQLSCLIKPLGMELINWCGYHCKKQINSQFLHSLLPQQLRWTMHGTIDYAKTAELMVKDERLDIERRYAIACINCLENEARDLFQSMGKERRQAYAKSGGHFKCYDQNPLIVFFTCTLSGAADDLRMNFRTMMLRSHSSLNMCLFKMMLPSGTRATCEYLFTKLSQEEKDQVFQQCSNVILSHTYAPSTSTILGYLSLMNEEQQRSMFPALLSDLLLCLLRWPLQSLFVEVAERGWQLMDTPAVTKVLCAIILKFRDGFGDYDYCRLFWWCWRLTSAEFNKQHFLGNHRFLTELVLTKREEVIKLVLNEGSWLFIKNVVDPANSHLEVIRDESVISDAALMECKQIAALNSSNDKKDEKRMRSEHLTRLVDIVMEERMKKRRL